MTKEITKAYILQEIQDKFTLREFEPDKFLFSETVIPIYNVAPHLTKNEVRHNTISITNAGAFVFFTVPENERWFLRAYQVIFGATGAHKGTGLYIGDRPGAGDYIYIDLKKNQEISYLVTLDTPVRIQPGSNLRYLIDTFVSTQNLTIDIDVEIEEIR